ncbi:MAG: HAMP domain-containing protein [Myxococcota bacterium]
MNIIQKIRSDLSLKLAVTLVVPLLGLVGLAAIFVTWHQTGMMRDQIIEKARVAARSGARFYGLTLEDAIDDGILTVQDVFDTNYAEIEGYNWGRHPKYHTRYDFYTDYSVLLFQDEFLRHPDFVFAVGQDVNGYIPTHNSRYQKKVTGNPQRDLVGNRSKRIFDDKVGLAAGKHEGKEPLVQIYERDTGVTMLDVSSPIYVKGKHWGGFRLAVSLERLAARSRSLLLTLGGVFALVGILAVLTILLMVRRAIAPAVELTQIADAISVGNGLETPVRVRSVDEIGRLARAIDRLRVSMKAAMGRLGE